MDILVTLRNLRKSRILQASGVAFAGTVAGILLSWFRPFEILELKSLDLFFHLASHPEWADSSVVLVAIDQNSLDFFARQKVGWPWPREFYGLLLDFLRKGEAATVGFDMDFSTADLDRLETDGAESDRAFAEAMRHTGCVVLGATLSTLERDDQPGTPILPRHLGPDPIAGAPPERYDRATAPLPEFQKAAAALGATNFETDIDDIARRTPLAYRFGNAALPQFGLACFARASGIRAAQLDSLLTSLPIGRDGRFLILWYGRGGPGNVFRYYSAHALIHSVRKLKANLPPDLPPGVFRGKHVIIGGSAVGLWDFKPTPFTSLEKYTGMEIQATILSNLLNRHFLLPTPWWLLLVAVMVLSLATSFAFLRIHNVALATLLILIAAVLYTGVAVLLFYYFLLWIPLVAPLSGAFVAYAVAAVVSYASEGKKRRLLRRAFNRYLSPAVVTEILRDIDLVELGGKTVEATVFFSDIKNFTSIAEQLTPKELVSYLNEYFSLASALIMKHSAMLDKYIGDAIMAIFGAPIMRPDNAAVACLTALEVQEALAAHYGRRDRPPRAPVFETRIGLHTGKMIVGNIGSITRLDYTAIGDTVNLASRLEGANKFFGTRIIISESTYGQAKDTVDVRMLDLLRVKGKQVPVRIYELLSRRGVLGDRDREKVTLFEEGLGQYRGQRFTAARKTFRRVLTVDPDDQPAALYIRRCEELSRTRLPKDWDGVYTLTAK